MGGRARPAGRRTPCRVIPTPGPGRRVDRKLRSRSAGSRVRWDLAERDAKLVIAVASSGTPGGAELRAPQWRDFEYRQSPEGIARFAEVFGAFCCTRGKEELYREGQARQIAIAPVNTIADVVADAQLRANSYFESHFDAGLGKDVIFPGPPYRLSRTPARRRGAAPGLGEHNRELRERVGEGSA